MEHVNKQTLIFLGPQGSGKGTQIDLLKQHLANVDAGRKILQFGMGQELRELGTRDNFTGKKTDSILRGGGLIPYSVSCAVFVQYLMNNAQGDEHVIIDGFPRTPDQVPMLDSALDFFEAKPAIVVCINISDEEAVKRLLLRGRNDDTEEGIRKRLAWSRKDTMPNVEWFRANPSYKVLDIDGERTVEEIQSDIISQLGL
jgi:adenylate kinase